MSDSAAREARARVYWTIEEAARRLRPRVALGEITAEQMKTELLRIGDAEFARIQRKISVQDPKGETMTALPTRKVQPGRDPLTPVHAHDAHHTEPAANPRPGLDPLARHHSRPGRMPARGGHGSAGNVRPGHDPLHPPRG